MSSNKLLNYNGKFAPVENMHNSPKIMTYFRGYGNIVVHTLNSDGTLTTAMSPWNRLQPMTEPFGNHLPPDSNQFNPQTNIAWLPPGLTVPTPSPMRQK